MRFGNFMAPFHPVGQNPTLAIERDLDLIVAMDRLGFMVQIERMGQTFKLRLPFPRPAEDRKDVKALIVEMSRASAGAA